MTAVKMKMTALRACEDESQPAQAGVTGGAATVIFTC